jgi:hypothetical protein
MLRVPERPDRATWMIWQLRRLTSIEIILYGARPAGVCLSSVGKRGLIMAEQKCASMVHALIDWTTNAKEM